MGSSVIDVDARIPVHILSSWTIAEFTRETVEVGAQADIKSAHRRHRRLEHLQEQTIMTAEEHGTKTVRISRGVLI